jgi:hypothetical protein
MVTRGDSTDMRRRQSLNFIELNEEVECDMKEEKAIKAIRECASIPHFHQGQKGYSCIARLDLPRL